MLDWFSTHRQLHKGSHKSHVAYRCMDDIPWTNDLIFQREAGREESRCETDSATPLYAWFSVFECTYVRHKFNIFIWNSMLSIWLSK